MSRGHLTPLPLLASRLPLLGVVEYGLRLRGSGAAEAARTEPPR